MSKNKTPLYQSLESATLNLESADFIAKSMWGEFQSYHEELLDSENSKYLFSTKKYMVAIQHLIEQSRRNIQRINNIIISIDAVIKDDLTQDTKKILLNAYDEPKTENEVQEAISE